MNPQSPRKKFTIKYDYERRVFTLRDSLENVLGEHVNGRELGRDAWQLGAEDVVFDYDLGLDERLPLVPFYAKYTQKG